MYTDCGILPLTATATQMIMGMVEEEDAEVDAIVNSIEIAVVIKPQIRHDGVFSAFGLAVAVRQEGVVQMSDIDLIVMFVILFLFG